MTDQALSEEYAIAAQMWKFSITDLSGTYFSLHFQVYRHFVGIRDRFSIVLEIARNSVRDSFFPEEVKKSILGEHYTREGANARTHSHMHVSSSHK